MLLLLSSVLKYMLHVAETLNNQETTTNSFTIEVHLIKSAYHFHVLVYSYVILYNLHIIFRVARFAVYTIDTFACILASLQ